MSTPRTESPSTPPVGAFLAFSVTMKSATPSVMPTASTYLCDVPSVRFLG